MDQPARLSEPSVSPRSGDSDHPESRKLGAIWLSGVVVGSMIGGRSFNLPQNMANGAGLAAIIIAWVITFVGMYILCNSFHILSDNQPDLKAGFGPFAGFQMAWGYWSTAALGNVAFTVLIMKILSYFFLIFGDRQNLAISCRRLPPYLGDLRHRDDGRKTFGNAECSRELPQYR